MHRILKSAVTGHSFLRKGALALVPLLMACISSSALADSEPDGASVYKRCAACHLPSRAGVPATFPPLRENVRSFAETAEGRRYLVLVLAKGLGGPIRAEGRLFSGVMPAQSMLSAGEVAAVLNLLAQPKAKFTAAEVTRLRASGAGLSPAQLAQLNARLTGR